MISNGPTILVSWPTRSSIHALAVLASSVLFLALGASVAQAAPTTFTVTNTSDSGAGSLRQAITDANSNTNPDDSDTIEFSIPADADTGCNSTTGVCTIAPASPLPDVTQSVIVDGYSQTGASPNTLATGSNAAVKIELSGLQSGSGQDGLLIAGSNSVVRGLSIIFWDDDAVDLSDASGNSVEGNYIGITATGNSGLQNGGNGVEINGSNNVVGGTSSAARNVISNNGDDGVYVQGPEATDNSIEGNYIGTNPSGTVNYGNSDDGVEIDGAPDNVIGGTSAAARNVISRNGTSGIHIQGAEATNNNVVGNYVGTDASGTQNLGNFLYGVLIIEAPNNTVGGTTTGARNIISGNSRSGVYIYDDGPSGNTIAGNYIGTDASGTQGLGNGGDGVEIVQSANNVVGGISAAARNIISGNGDSGVDVNNFASGNTIAGNYIGTDASGTQSVGNTVGVKISVSANNVVGGTSAASRNVIAGNGADGVAMFASDSTGNRILFNSVYDNGALGINLEENFPGPYGVVTPNDPQDPDFGANNLQNFPLISSAKTTATSTTINATLNSIPSESYTIQFFSNLPGENEGRTFIGQQTVTTDAGGDASTTFSPTGKIPAGRTVTATATRTSTGDTSEFSQAVEVEDGIPPTVVSTNPPNGATGVVPGINVSATFSEQMKASTINNTTFKLFKKVGATNQRVPAVVTYSAGQKRATLNPNANLTLGATYLAQVTTGAQDVAGNGLAARKDITFTVRP